MKKLITIRSKGEGYTADVIEDNDGSLFYVADADIDVDGSPNWRRDPYGQADTSLHYHGKPINSDEVPGIVVPPEIINAVGPIVLGCQASIEYRGKKIAAVVFDTGPHNKLGEISAAAAEGLGINPDPNHGGVDGQEVTYRLWPGKPATVEGVTYDLQDSR
jgi:hypothetical protein